MNKKFYSVSEVVEIIGNISKGNVYRLIKKGEIPAMYIGQRPFIPCSWGGEQARRSRCMATKGCCPQVTHNGETCVG